MDKIERTIQKFIDRLYICNGRIVISSRKELAQAIRDIDPWIPVSEGLPEKGNGKFYRVWVQAGIEVHATLTKYGRWRLDRGKYVERVTHWLKITPPQES